MLAVRDVFRSAPLLLAVTLAMQPSAPAPPEAHLRSLPWNQLNFLHTTDTHGWHGGHLQEGSYSADWGDYISFAKHLRDRADEDGVDLLIIDTGDRVEGNGLYDASEPRGLYTFDIFKQQDMDVITSGNHELYKANSSNDEYYKLAKHYNESYIASNLDVYDHKIGELVPLAPRFKKFTTKNQGIRVLAMGFLFDFTGGSNNTVVQPVEETVKTEWFQNAIKDRDVDVFLIAGHVALRSMEFDLIYKTIRSQNWDAKIQFFGGHFHIRDWKRWDSAAYGLASGRYMETIGFSSIGGIKTADREVSDEETEMRKSKSKFQRRYIDNNLYSLYHHSGKNSSTFDTLVGANVTKQITKARSALGLDELHGCAPQDFWLDRAAIESNQSIFSWLDKQVLPDQLSQGLKSSMPKLVIQNTGALRFDVFEGAFTKDTTFLISPFTSGFRQIKDVPYETAARLLDVLNSIGPILSQKVARTEIDGFEVLESLTRDPIDMPALAMPEQLAREQSLLPSHEAGRLMQSADMQKSLSGKIAIPPGYVTSDDDGSDGDDTVHSDIFRYKIPQVMETRVDWPLDDKTTVSNVDVVYNGFIEGWVLHALNFLGSPHNSSSTSTYLEGTSLTTVIADWVGSHWPCGEEFEKSWKRSHRVE